LRHALLVLQLFGLSFANGSWGALPNLTNVFSPFTGILHLVQMASAASARAHRRSIHVVMVVRTMVIPLACQTTTLLLVLLHLHPWVDMLILHAGQAPSLKCTK
jgi:hypothetical protein